MLPAEARTSSPSRPRWRFSQVHTVIPSWPWEEVHSSLLPMWGLLPCPSSQEAFPGRDLHSSPSAGRSHSLCFQAPRAPQARRAPSRHCHRLRPTSSSLGMATCTSAGKIPTPSIHLTILKPWLVAVIRCLFWDHQTPQEA